MKISKTLLKVVIGIGTLLFVVWIIASGRSKYLTDLLARRQLKQADEEERKAREDLERLQREKSDAKEQIDAARNRVEEAARKVAEAKTTVENTPADRRSDDFNDWWDQRHSSADKSGIR